jgi:hypothetical protein
VSWCRGACSVRLGGRWGVSSGRGGNRSWPGRPPRVELGTVGDAHEVAVPRGLKVRVLNRISNPAGRGSELPIEYLWDVYSVWNTIEMAGEKLIFSAQVPTWRANCQCGK